MSKSDDNHTNVLLEDINGKFDTILEAITSMQPQVAKIASIEESVAELKTDVKVIKAAVKDQGKQLHDHDRKVKGQFRVRRA
jgi:uncharacterized protein YoxC